MTLPLRILFVWHHHQPYYKTDGTFLMPWVRMHGIKDYWDMVRILDDYPEIKQTFNFAPSLLEQIRDYLDGSATDAAFLLSEKDPATFSEQDKINALKTFFLANADRMIKRYPRYAELLAKRGNVRGDRDLYAAKDRFNSQDFRDLQVWWNLAWVGEYSRFDQPFKYYLDKQKNFSEDEKRQLLSSQMDIIAKIIPHHIKALKRGQIEIAISPFYHPILPLLCDSSVAIDANPRTSLPKSRYRYPEDAGRQMKAALDYGNSVFGERIRGMWPSEGSVSDAAMKLIGEHRVEWVATDESILHKSMLKSGKTLSHDFIEKYFAYNYVGGGNQVKMFFRDHSLSDKIGFVYSNWTPDAAAHDFVSNLLKIRDSVIRTYGEKELDAAVVSVILDGENAWEFYQSDGKDFLRTLYYLIENEPRIETVLPAEVYVKRENSIRRIEPGSWINGNFDIWIGQHEDNRAWDLLHEARKAYDKHSTKIPAKQRNLAFREIMICEGSDWCWWYGDEHKSAQAEEFDKLFRYHLKHVYSALGLDSPPSLDEPIKRKIEHLTYRQPMRMISPRFAKKPVEDDWKYAGFVEQEQPTGAMQKTGQQIKRVRFGNDRTNLYIMIETTKRVSTEKIEVVFFSPAPTSVEIENGIVFKAEAIGEEGTLSVNYVKGEAVQIKISSGKMNSDEAALAVNVFDENSLLDSLPHQGVAKFKLYQ